jgi:hypothetical protein
VRVDEAHGHACGVCGGGGGQVGWGARA